MIRRRRLRVGVNPALAQLPAQTGNGRVWKSVLPELERIAILTDLKPDVVLADGHSGRITASVPVVVQVHEAPWFEHDHDHLFAPGFLERMASLTAESVASAAHVITPSEWSRRQVVDGYRRPANTVSAVPHGVDRKVFRPLTAAQSSVPYVLFAATLHPRKNLEAVRGAMSQLARQGLPHQLVIVASDAPDRADSSDLAAAALAEIDGAPGRVHRVEARDDEDLARMMSGAAAFCLPSFSEGFGLTALEAMACGAPVVVSDQGALPEVVDGAGLLVAPTADAVAAALLKVLTDHRLAHSMRRQGLHRAIEFTWRRTAKGWLQALAAVA